MVIQRLRWRTQSRLFRWYTGVTLLVSVGRLVFNAPIAGVIGLGTVLILCFSPDPIARIESTKVRKWSYVALICANGAISVYTPYLDFGRI